MQSQTAVEKEGKKARKEGGKIFAFYYLYSHSTQEPQSWILTPWCELLYRTTVPAPKSLSSKFALWIFNVRKDHCGHRVWLIQGGRIALSRSYAEPNNWWKDILSRVSVEMSWGFGKMEAVHLAEGEGCRGEGPCTSGEGTKTRTMPYDQGGEEVGGSLRRAL